MSRTHSLSLAEIVFIDNIFIIRCISRIINIKAFALQFQDKPDAERRNLASLAGHTEATQNLFYTADRTSNQRFQAWKAVSARITTAKVGYYLLHNVK
jgi:hypothetical protein